MATDAQTLTNEVAAAKYAALSDRDLLLSLAGYWGNQASLTAQQAVNTNSQEKYAALSDEDLDKCLLAILS